MTSLKNYGTVNNKKPSGSDSQWVQFSAVHPQNDNNLIIVRRCPGYFLFLWYVVLLQGGMTMTTNQTPVQRCQYCGSDDLGLGWQHGEAIVTFKKHGLWGSRLRYLICRHCGAVVYQWVAEPHKFPSIK